MGGLDPQFEVEIEFPFGKLFDPGDPLSQWVANLARATNDLLVAHRRLDETFAGDIAIGHEAIYDIKNVAAHTWELIKFLGQSRTDEIERFVRNLPGGAHQKYKRAFDLLDRPSQPNEKSFKAILASARDQASHYSELDHKLVKAALTRMAEPEDDGTPGIGKLMVGKTTKDFYADFASVFDYQLFVATKGKDLKPLEEFVPQLRELAVTLISFASETVQRYLAEHQDNLTVNKLGT